jgi:hypothetical protein
VFRLRLPEEAGRLAGYNFFFKTSLFITGILASLMPLDDFNNMIF